jgi:hypothetical protein
MSRPAVRTLLSLLVALATAGPLAPPLAAEPAATRLLGQVVALDSGALDGLRVRVRAGSHVGEGRVAADGSFEFALPGPLRADTVEVHVADADRRYHPALLRVPRRELHLEQRVALVPTRWRIGAGMYEGRIVPISMERAYRPTCGTCISFFQRVSRIGSGVAAGGVAAWPEDQFPLRVAFDRDRSEARVTARDSAAFWGVANHMEHVIGRRFFRPATYEQTLSEDEHGPNDVVLVWVVPSLRSHGRGAVAYRSDRITTGVLWLRSTSLIFDTHGPSLVAHELLHTLGFGHTCAWRSVMADVERCPNQRSPVPTPEDVAYIELAREITALAWANGARWGLEAALAGETTPGLGPLAAGPVP